jgi:hypothetical protein
MRALDGELVHLLGHLLMQPDQLIVGVAAHGVIIAGGR